MAKFNKRIALGTAAALGFMLASSPAAAQATRTWISGVGADENPCSRTAPCRTWQGAMPKTAAGGEINCLDGGGFGAVSITKSITLICDYNQGGILVAGQNGVIVNGVDAIVVLSGLDIEGLGNSMTSPGINGVNVVNAASVTIRNTQIRGFRGGYGVRVAPASSIRVLLDNVFITDGGAAGNANTGGVAFLPTNNTSINATIHNSRIYSNLNAGLRIDTTGTTGSSVSVKIDDSNIDNNGQVGVLAKAPAGAGTVRVMINDSSIALNGTFGLFGNGTGATVRVEDTAITGNGTGVSAANGSTVASYGNNQLDGNTNDGAFSGTIPPK